MGTQKSNSRSIAIIIPIHDGIVARLAALDNSGNEATHRFLEGIALQKVSFTTESLLYP
jgi:hypothetical protein